MTHPDSLRRRGKPEESAAPSEKDGEDSKKLNPLQGPHIKNYGIHLWMQTIIIALGSFLTFYKIWFPAEVVFDEVHFGKFASYYLKRAYFFDVHPPLAKLMIAAVGYLVGYDGHFDFESIGDPYIQNNVPYIFLRALPAILNVGTIGFLYNIMMESGYSVIVCVLTSLLYTFDNAFIGQNRLILLDSMLIFFMVSCIYCYVRFRKLRHREFSLDWYFWLFATGATMALTLSVKMVGLFMVTCIGLAVIADLWDLFDFRRGLTMGHFMKHFRVRALALIVLPTIIYLFWFYVHFAILTESGPGDSFMSPSFQETLANSDIRLKALDIHYYDNITLKHRDTEVFLHSHNLFYPLRYEDGRISSQGQQVTGVMEQDDNCWWRVLPTQDLESDERVPVKNRDVIRLEHIATGTILLTHDVASPLMPTNEEITTVGPEERYNETLFQIVLDETDHHESWMTHMNAVRLIHLDTMVAIWTHDETLPEWALGQQEVNGNKNTQEKSNYWVAQEIQGLNASEINMAKKKEVKSMPFLSKFLELQARMLSHNSGMTTPHPYQSQPHSWPLMLKGISYWAGDESRGQIYLTGNLVGWYLTLASITVFGGVFLADLLSRQRGIEPIDAHVRCRLMNSSGFFLLLYLVHYLPFYVMGRTLFLHHYLPAQTCGYLVLGSLFQFMFIDGIDTPISNLMRNDSSKVIRPRQNVLTQDSSRTSFTTYAAAFVIIGAQIGLFIFLAPLTYGTPGLSPEQFQLRAILPGWDLQFAK